MHRGRGRLPPLNDVPVEEDGRPAEPVRGKRIRPGLPLPPPPVVVNYTLVSLEIRVLTRKWSRMTIGSRGQFGESRNLLYCFYSLEREEMPETAGNQPSKMRT